MTRGVAGGSPGGVAARSWDATLGWFLLLYFFLNFGQGVFPPLLPQVMDALGLSFASAGLLGTVFGLARFLVDVPAGLFVERLGVAGILHVAVGLLLLGTGLSAWATSLPTMLLARGLVGIGSGMSIVVSILYLMRRGSATQRTRLGNLYEVAVISGTATSAALGGAIAARVGWRGGFVMAALAIGIGWLVATLRVLPGTREVLRPRCDPPQPALARGPGVAWGRIAAIYLATLTMAIGWAGGVSTFLPLYGGQGLKLPPEVLGRTLAIAYGVEVCLLVPVGWAADTLGKLRVMVPGFLVMLLGLLLIPSMRSVLSYGVACTLVTIGMTVWMIPPALLAEQSRGGFRGGVAGLYRFVSDLGYILAPGAVGWLIGRGGYRMAAAAMAAIFVGSVGLSLAMLRSPRSSAARRSA